MTDCRWVALNLGRKKAAEEIALKAEELIRDMVNPEKPHNKGFAAGCGIMARYSRALLIPGAFRDEFDLQLAAEITAEVALELGRQEAAERIAARADRLVEGMANPERVYNQGFAHGCQVIARHARDIGKGDSVGPSSSAPDTQPWR